MPDAPDWYQYRLESNKSLLDDMAELASRLGSPNTFERGGSTLFIDNMDHGLSPYNHVVGGAGSVIQVDPATSYAGGQSIQMTCGAVPGAYCNLSKYIQPIDYSRVGVEFSFSFGGAPDMIRLRIYVIISGILYTYIIIVNTVLGTIAYQDSAGVMIVIDPFIILGAQQRLFHSVKLVYDPTVNEYTRLYVNQNLYDLRGIPCLQAASTDTDWIEIAIFYTENLDNGGSIWIDNIIITSDEP